MDNKVKKEIKNVAIIGLGTLAGIVGGGIVSSNLTGKMKGFSKEVVGGGMAVGGAYGIAKGKKETKKLATGFAGAGSALLYQSLKSRFFGNQQSKPAVESGEDGQAGGSNQGSEPAYPGGGVVVDV